MVNVSKGKSKVSTVKFDKQFRAIQEITTQLLQQALGATINQQAFQTTLFSMLQPEFERMTRESDLIDALGSPEERQKYLRESIDRNRALSEQALGVSRQLSSSAANLGTLTDTDRELISSAIGSARAVGQNQIDEFVSSNFRNANEVAAARGMSPRDAPIGNIRGRIAEEAITQKGLLESQLAGQQAGLSIDLPMQRTALLSDVAGTQLGFAQAGEQFQAALAQNATANRLNMTQSTGQLGLGLAGTSGMAPGALGASRPAFGSESKTGSVGISMRSLKHRNHAVDRALVLAKLQALPIEAWNYLWDHAEEDPRMGPYADDFARAFGGDGITVDYMRAISVSMIALQELAGRVDRLEALVQCWVTGEEPSEALLESVPRGTQEIVEHA